MAIFSINHNLSSSIQRRSELYGFFLLDDTIRYLVVRGLLLMKNSILDLIKDDPLVRVILLSQYNNILENHQVNFKL